MAAKTGWMNALIDRLALPRLSTWFDTSGLPEKLLRIDNKMVQFLLEAVSSYPGMIVTDVLIEQAAALAGVPISVEKRKELEQILEILNKKKKEFGQQKVAPLSKEDTGKFFGKVRELSYGDRERFWRRYWALSKEQMAVAIHVMAQDDIELKALADEDSAFWVNFRAIVAMETAKKQDKDGSAFWERLGDGAKEISEKFIAVCKYLVEETSGHLKLQEAKLDDAKKAFQKQWGEKVPKAANRSMGYPWSPMRFMECLEDWKVCTKGTEKFAVLYRLFYPWAILIGIIGVILLIHCSK